jgi:hypothetical protein
VPTSRSRPSLRSRGRVRATSDETGIGGDRRTEHDNGAGLGGASRPSLAAQGGSRRAATRSVSVAAGSSVACQCPAPRSDADSTCTVAPSTRMRTAARFASTRRSVVGRSVGAPPRAGSAPVAASARFARSVGVPGWFAAGRSFESARAPPGPVERQRPRRRGVELGQPAAPARLERGGRRPQSSASTSDRVRQRSRRPLPPAACSSRPRRDA